MKNYKKVLLVFTSATFLFASASASGGCMDTDNSFWLPAQQSMYDQLMGIMTCPVDSDAAQASQVDQVACNYFVAKALQVVYNVNDFAPDQNNGNWITADAIADTVSTSTNWSLLGYANDQSVLNNAAAGASNGQPVIAVVKGNPHGHVVLVLPGALQGSTTWIGTDGNTMKVPNSAAFSLNNVDKAYVFCRLSAGFSNDTKDQTMLYWRVKVQ